MAISVEAYLISSILRGRDFKTAMGKGVTADMFHVFQDEWNWLESHYAQYRQAPSKEAFKRAWPNFSVKQVDDIDHFADEVRRNHARLLMLDMMQDAADSLGDGDIETAVKKANSAIIQIAAAMGTNNDADIFTDYHSILNEVETRVRRVKENGSAGIPTGMASIDNRTGGFNPGELIIVAMRLGVGKSWTLQSFAGNAVVLGHTVQFDALEMTRSAVAMRVQALIAGTLGKQVFSSTMLMQGKGFNTTDYKQFLRELKRSIAGRLHVSDTSRGRVGVTTVAAQIERNQPDAVYIDYLTLMAKDGPDWQGVAKLSGDLKSLAQNYQVPIIAAAQLNRESGITRRGEPPGVEAIAQADAIGQDADMVITGARKSPSVLSYKMAKYRNGPDGYVWHAHFDPERGVLKEISANKAQELVDKDRDLADKEALA